MNLSFSDERLIQAVRQTGARLVVLDPLSAYIGEETGINAANEVRRQFRPLIEIAREQRCAVLIVHHMNKAIGQKAINRAVGSVDIVGAARSVLLVARTDREHPDERIMAQVKCNVGPTGSAIVFSVGGGAVQWLEETATLEEANYKLYRLNKEQKKLEGIISLIPPELLAQLTKTEREARKNQERGKNR